MTSLAHPQALAVAHRSIFRITAGINWPILDGGVTKSRVQVAKDDLASQQIALDQLRQNVDLEVRSAHYRMLWTPLSSSMRTSRAFTVVTEALRLARVRYQAGAGTVSRSHQCARRRWRRIAITAPVLRTIPAPDRSRFYCSAQRVDDRGIKTLHL